LLTNRSQTSVKYNALFLLDTHFIEPAYIARPTRHELQGRIHFRSSIILMNHPNRTT